MTGLHLTIAVCGSSFQAYVALVNDPPVHNFVSICGPLEGEATCPDNIMFDLICPIWKLDPYGAGLAFSGYCPSIVLQRPPCSDFRF